MDPFEQHKPLRPPERATPSLARALLDAGDDADAVIRRHQLEGPAAEHKVLSHDEVAVRFPPERLKSGPCPVGVLDNEVKAADCAWRASNGRKSSSTSSLTGSTAAGAPSYVFAPRPFDNAMFGLGLGDKPRLIIKTTPNSIHEEAGEDGGRVDQNKLDICQYPSLPRLPQPGPSAIRGALRELHGSMLHAPWADGLFWTNETASATATVRQNSKPKMHSFSRDWDRNVDGSPKRLGPTIFGLSRLSKIVTDIPIA
jgi:hypothetical protein